MKILLINAHQEYPFSKGQLNQALCEKAENIFKEKGHEVIKVTMKDQYNANEEVEKHIWADAVFLQSPVNWMGLPWSFKKYMDEVYSVGMDGRLCNGDGRNSSSPKSNYGGGGALAGKHYMLSLTFNAPKEAFNDKSEYLFEGKSVDDLFFPQHMNFKFFGMKALPTFACYDVMKNPDTEKDFQRFESHLKESF